MAKITNEKKDLILNNILQEKETYKGAALGVRNHIGEFHYMAFAGVIAATILGLITTENIITLYGGIVIAAYVGFSFYFTLLKKIYIGITDNYLNISYTKEGRGSFVCIPIDELQGLNVKKSGKIHVITFKYNDVKYNLRLDKEYSKHSIVNQFEGVNAIVEGLN